VLLFFFFDPLVDSYIAWAMPQLGCTKLHSHFRRLVRIRTWRACCWRCRRMIFLYRCSVTRMII